MNKDSVEEGPLNYIPGDIMLPHNSLTHNSVEDCTSRWLILDGLETAQRYCHGHNQEWHGIAIAAEELLKKSEGMLIVCVPESVKHWQETCYYFDLKNKLRDLLIYVPSEARLSIMEKLAKTLDAVIVTQTGSDTWSEQNQRILSFTFMKDSFVLPEDPWGKQKPTLSDLLKAKRDTNELPVKELVQDLLGKWEKYSKIMKEHPYLSLTCEPVKDGLPRVIIDGKSVAMSHGLDVFFSYRGIYLAVKHFENKGYSNITVYVKNFRMNSINTVYGQEHLQDLDERGLISWTSPHGDEDCFILERAKATNALIITNNQFREFNQDWKDTKKRCVSFEFDGNTFKAFMLSTEAASRSSVQPTDTGEGQTLESSGQTP